MSDAAGGRTTEGTTEPSGQRPHGQTTNDLAAPTLSDFSICAWSKDEVAQPATGGRMPQGIGKRSLPAVRLTERLSHATHLSAREGTSQPDDETERGRCGAHQMQARNGDDSQQNV